MSKCLVCGGRAEQQNICNKCLSLSRAVTTIRIRTRRGRKLTKDERRWAYEKRMKIQHQMYVRNRAEKYNLRLESEKPKLFHELLQEVLNGTVKPK